MLALIKRFQCEFTMALIIITHDLAVIAELADMVLIMYLGKSVEYGPVQEIFSSPKHPYTRALLTSIPRLGSGSRQKTGIRIDSISGSVPSPYEMPSGCLFHPRCTEFMAGACERIDPQARVVGSNHQVSCLLYDGSVQQ